MGTVAVALVHYPVVDRSGAVITTAITNLDLHDLARSACTYGASALYIVHPIAAQRELAERVRSHWVDGAGARRIPSREPAMRLVRITSSLDDVYGCFGGRASVDLYATTACAAGRAFHEFRQARARIRDSARPSVVLFGTGWGLAASVLDGADVLLEPINGANECGYNHLSVRAACAIVLDRLLSPVSSD
jgi:hypothetical protein